MNARRHAARCMQTHVFCQLSLPTASAHHLIQFEIWPACLTLQRHLREIFVVPFNFEIPWIEPFLRMLIILHEAPFHLLWLMIGPLYHLVAPRHPHRLQIGKLSKHPHQQSYRRSLRFKEPSLSFRTTLRS